MSSCVNESRADIETAMKVALSIREEKLTFIEACKKNNADPEKIKKLIFDTKIINNIIDKEKRIKRAEIRNKIKELAKNGLSPAAIQEKEKCSYNTAYYYTKKFGNWNPQKKEPVRPEIKQSLRNEDELKTTCGSYVKITKNGKNRLTKAGIVQIKYLYSVGKTVKEIVDTMGVSKSTIYNYIKGEDIPGYLDEIKNPYLLPDIKTDNGKTSEKDVIDIDFDSLSPREIRNILVYYKNCLSPDSLIEFKKEMAVYDSRKCIRKWKLNKKFAESIGAKTVIDVFSGLEGSSWVNFVGLPRYNVDSNDVNRFFQASIDCRDAADIFLSKRVEEAVRKDIVDLDAFEIPFKYLGFAAFLAKKGIIVTIPLIGKATKNIKKRFFGTIKVNTETAIARARSILDSTGLITEVWGSMSTSRGVRVYFKILKEIDECTKERCPKNQ